VIGLQDAHRIVHVLLHLFVGVRGRSVGRTPG
jgi:hypothetical protein